MITRVEQTMWVKIYMAGDISTAQRVCQTYVNEVGLCITIEPTTYVYTGGAEEGFVVGLINYPLFPTSHLDEIVNKAETLAMHLCASMCIYVHLAFKNPIRL